MTITTQAEFFTLLKGATFLASGGGGPYGLAKDIVETYLNGVATFSIDFSDLNTLTQNDWCCVAAGMAAPSKGIHLTPQDIVEPTINAVGAMEDLIRSSLYVHHTSFKNFSSFNKLILGEIGAMNVVIPLITAYKLGNGISVVNGDSAGRSVPTINLSLFASSQNVMPNMATSAGDHNLKFTTLSLDSYEDLNTAYSKLISAGLIGIDTGLALAPMNGKTLQDNNLVKNTLSTAYAIGEIMENNENTWIKIVHIQECLAPSNRSVKLLCTGKVVAYNTKSIDDNDVGYMSIETEDNRTFTLSIQNETITGQFEDDISIAVTGPDSICYLSASNGALPNGEIYDNTLIEEKFAQGKEVNIHVIAIQADSVVTSNEVLMKSWRSAYKMARYYGAYNGQLWAIGS